MPRCVRPCQHCASFRLFGCVHRGSGAEGREWRRSSAMRRARQVLNELWLSRATLRRPLCGRPRSAWKSRVERLALRRVGCEAVCGVTEMSKSTGADHRQGQLCTQRHLPPNPTPRKRCSCCAPLEDTDAHHATRRRDTQSCRARAPPRACVRAFGRGKAKKRQREPELPVACL
ncbi:hypothetical protein ERJ75_000912200 [Trypanosoma vivax]|nr:hypothetical protein ERJ75_000912200 [Trypanosoma vivax]